MDVMSFYPPTQISLGNIELKVELGTNLSPLALPTSFPGPLIFLPSRAGAREEGGKIRNLGNENVAFLGTSFARL